MQEHFSVAGTNSEGVQAGSIAQGSASIDQVVMPGREVVRVNSEDRLLLALVSALKSPPEIQRPPLSDEPSSRFLNVVPYLIHVLSRGPGEDLFDFSNRPYLIGLGAQLLRSAGNSFRDQSSHSQRTPVDSTNGVIFFNPDVAPTGSMDDPQSYRSGKLMVTAELDLHYYQNEYISHNMAWKAAVAGFLCAKIFATGFGPNEEEALRSLGGSPDVFREALNAPPIELKKPYDAIMVNLSLANLGDNQVRISSWDWPNFSGAYWSGDLLVNRFGPRLYGFVEDDISCRFSLFRESFDYSSRFDGLKKEQIEQILGENPSKGILLSQVEARHTSMMNGLAADGERRILSGTDVWSSNIRDRLPELRNLHWLDLSNLDLHQTDLSRKGMSGCRFDGTDLNRANCNGTDFSDCRFGNGENPADLTHSWLAGANLRGADLSEAFLCKVFWTEDVLEWNGTSKAESVVSRPPEIDKSTKFLPKRFIDWSNQQSGWARMNLFRKKLRADSALLADQARRFEGWTAEQFDEVIAGIGKFSSQGRALAKLKAYCTASTNSPSLLTGNSFTAAALLTSNVLTGETPEELAASVKRLETLSQNGIINVISGVHDNRNFPKDGFRGIFVQNATLRLANMAEMDLTEAVFTDSDLSGINFQGTNLDGAVFVCVKLSGAIFEGASLRGATFVDCELDGTKLNGATLFDTHLLHSTITNIDFTEGVVEGLLVFRTIMENVKFSGCAEKGVILKGLLLVDSIMWNAEFGGNTTVSEVELSGSILVGDGPGVLDPTQVECCPFSCWRKQVVQLVQDPQLGEVNTALELTRLTDRPRWGQARWPTAGSFLIQEIFSRSGEQLGSVKLLEHLSVLGIGCKNDRGSLILSVR